MVPQHGGLNALTVTTTLTSAKTLHMHVSVAVNIRTFGSIFTEERGLHVAATCEGGAQRWSM